MARFDRPQDGFPICTLMISPPPPASRIAAGSSANGKTRVTSGRGSIRPETIISSTARATSSSRAGQGALERMERDAISAALEHHQGNRTRAALLLGGLSRTTLISKMKRLGLFEPAQA